LHCLLAMEEVIVVGSGPAGCTAAIALALRGREVLILERDQHPRAKLCAGGLPPKVVGALPVGVEGLVEQRVDRIRFRCKGRHELELTFERPVIHMVQRERLDQRLAESAVRLGARLLEGLRVVRLLPKSDHVVVETTNGTYTARAVVAADGALGSGAKVLGREGIRLCPAVQAEVRVSDDQLAYWEGRLGCDFGAVPGGIGWVFPKKEALSVGACTFRPPVDLGSALERYIRLEGIRPAGSYSIRSHPLAVWNGRLKFSRGGVLVAGDAAGLVNPLTGAGIRRACISGQLAAEAVHAYLAGGGRCVKDLASYDRRVVADLVDELERARLFARVFYRAPSFFYRVGVMNARVNPFVGQLLSGQKSYLEVFRELVSGEWMRR
jgi:geranylgeranyl reductase family protein